MKHTILFLCFLSFSILAADGVQPAGSGSAAYPYQITSLDNLLWVSTNSSSWASNFLQINDIDASETQNWNGGDGYAPIGNSSTTFSGVYDGQQFTISDLYINRSTNDIGLFGKVDGSTVISNLGLVDCDITGNDKTGGFAGVLRSSAVIEQCFCTGVVSGNEKVGGLIGYLRDNAIMQRCFNDASVNIFEYGGGLCGVVDDNSLVIDSYNSGYIDGSCFIGGVTGCCEGATLTNCYNTGEVWGDFILYTCGINGLEWPNTDVNGCFFDGNTTGIWMDYGGTGLTTGQMQDPATFIDAGWDFIGENTNGTDDVWGMHFDDYGGYPFLAWQGFVHFPPAGTEPSGGGTSLNPYTVTDLDHILWVSTHPESWDKYYIQMDDIDATATANWDGGQGLPPIGSSGAPFTGFWGGYGHEISNLYINRNETYQGMFGKLSNAQIVDLLLYDCNVTGNTYAGALCGGAESSQIENCIITGDVSGNGRVGGMTGSTINGATTNCTSSATVSNTADRSGGLIGVASGGTIDQCSSSASVTGEDYVGGLLGLADGVLVINCSSTATVDGLDEIGGLVGRNTSYSIVQDCWAEATVNGNLRTGGFAGKNRDYALIERCRANATVTIDGLWHAGGFCGLNTENGEIIDSYSHGDVTAVVVNATYIAGFSGGCYYNATITNCYSTTHVGNMGSEKMGFCGNVEEGSAVIDCFWDVETSGRNTSDGGIGLSTDEMKSVAPYIASGWDFIDETANGTIDLWGVHPEHNMGYPFLAWQGFEHLIYLSQQPSGTGTVDNPYIIGTLHHLGWVSLHDECWGAFFQQNQTIDAAATAGWDNTGGFRPIGNDSVPFTGVWSGQGNIIDSLKCSRPSESQQALFGNTLGATVSGVQLTNCDITGHNRVGGVIGYCQQNSLIEECSVQGMVSAGLTCGGVAGMTSDSSVERCWNDAAVTGNNNVGGIVGRNTNLAIIIDCYAFGSATGTYRIGGIVGRNENSQVETSYSACAVSGTGANVGGLIGSTSIVTGEDCFWDIDVSGQTASNGGVGLSSAEMIEYSSYENAGWDFVGESANGNNDVWEIDGVHNNGYPWFAWEGVTGATPQTPMNLQITYSLTGVNLTWDPSDPPSTYRVFSSSDPETGFVLNENGVFDGSSWTVPIPVTTTFYRVTSVHYADRVRNPGAKAESRN